MARKYEKLTAERLRELFTYDPGTGDWVRILSTHPYAKTGPFVPSNHGEGYGVMRIEGRLYSAHRLAWFYVHGEWPTGHIDHVNGNKLDNRICNLRDATMDVNAQNLKKAQRNNSCGFLGVTQRGSKFIAQITIGKRGRYLGIFSTGEEAHAAYLQSKRKHHEGNTL